MGFGRLIWGILRWILRNIGGVLRGLRGILRGGRIDLRGLRVLRVLRVLRRKGMVIFGDNGVEHNFVNGVIFFNQIMDIICAKGFNILGWVFGDTVAHFEVDCFGLIISGDDDVIGKRDEQ